MIKAKYAEYCRNNPREKVIYKDFEAGYKAALYVMNEYIFNTATWQKELPSYNISEEYLKQTIKFLNEQ